MKIILFSLTASNIFFTGCQKLSSDNLFDSSDEPALEHDLDSVRMIGSRCNNLLDLTANQLTTALIFWQLYHYVKTGFYISSSGSFRRGIIFYHQGYNKKKEI